MIIDGIKYLTVEHYYQAAKFSDIKHKELKEKIINSENADQAKKLARKLFDNIKSYDLILKWEESKIPAMKRAIFEKFTQHKDLKEKLLLSGNSLLIEDSPRDDFWGGQLPNSKNILGTLLMQLRTQLREMEFQEQKNEK